MWVKRVCVTTLKILKMTSETNLYQQDMLNIVLDLYISVNYLQICLYKKNVNQADNRVETKTAICLFLNKVVTGIKQTERIRFYRCVWNLIPDKLLISSIYKRYLSQKNRRNIFQNAKKMVRLNNNVLFYCYSYK